MQFRFFAGPGGNAQPDLESSRGGCGEVQTYDVALKVAAGLLKADLSRSLRPAEFGGLIQDDPDAARLS